MALGHRRQLTSPTSTTSADSRERRPSAPRVAPTAWPRRRLPTLSVQSRRHQCPTELDPWSWLRPLRQPTPRAPPASSAHHPPHRRAGSSVASTAMNQPRILTTANPNSRCPVASVEHRACAHGHDPSILIRSPHRCEPTHRRAADDVEVGRDVRSAETRTARLAHPLRANG